MPYNVDMYVARASWPSSNGKIYQSIFLRQSYRDGPHVRKRESPTSPTAIPKKSLPSNSLSKHQAADPYPDRGASDPDGVVYRRGL
ncbi:MAG: hypothetical protein DMG57_33895 [Acidobacteria bacterium]|nr:MAG: hypothetical protein DMG57_33895 [Acidobacteriota bacterium]